MMMDDAGAMNMPPGELNVETLEFQLTFAIGNSPFPFLPSGKATESAKYQWQMANEIQMTKCPNAREPNASNIQYHLSQ
jgi:hypothetical protein